MNEFSRIRRPVIREGAARYLLLTLLSFAGSVILTRLFLALTGYPQLGGGALHIAHVLWGGLLLFVASLLPLVLSNRWVYTASALLAGTGVGLFIDEVGKFVTQTNDYFYPAAAPIIYAFFLLTVLVYLQVRREPAKDPRTELYQALDALAEVLDHDLDVDEQAELEERLRFVARRADQPHLAQLAAALLEFIGSEAVVATPVVPRWWQKWWQRVTVLEQRWISRERLRPLLAVGLVLLAVWALADLVLFVSVAVRLEDLGRVIDALAETGRVVDVRSLSWYTVRVALGALVGLLLLVAARLLAMGRDERGLSFAYYGLILSLTTVDLLVFYLDQFSAVVGALAQLGALLGVIYYRRRFVLPQRAGAVAREVRGAERET